MVALFFVFFASNAKNKLVCKKPPCSSLQPCKDATHLQPPNSQMVAFKRDEQFEASATRCFYAFAITAEHSLPGETGGQIIGCLMERLIDVCINGFLSRKRW